MKFSKAKEDYYRDKLASLLPGAEVEVRGPFGLIDIMTPFEIIEVKHLAEWKHALGQILAYGWDLNCSYLTKRVHLIVPEKKECTSLLWECIRCFWDHKVDVSWELQGEKNVPVISIGGEIFPSIAKVKQRVNKIRIPFNKLKDEIGENVTVRRSLSPEDAKFMIDFVSTARWCQTRFGGRPLDVRARIRFADRMERVQSRRHYHQNKKDRKFIYCYVVWEFLDVDNEWTPIKIDNYFREDALKAERIDVVFDDNQQIHIEPFDKQARAEVEEQYQRFLRNSEEMESRYEYVMFN